MTKTINYFILLSLSLSLSLHAEQAFKSYLDNEWPDSRYVNNGDRTVTDTTTDLMWQRCPLGLSGSSCETGTAKSMNWDEALVAAEESNHSGYSDWRLPSIEELKGLVAEDRYNPAININAFPASSDGFFWSSTPDSNYGNDAWYVYFFDGFAGSHNPYNFNFVRLVRGGD